ncbi:hypothetical protein COOONC_20608 [Cooperia oncophora]
MPRHNRVTFQYFQYSNIGSLVMGLSSAAGRMTDAGTCKLSGQLFLSYYVQLPNSEVFAVTSAGVSDQQARDGDIELISNVQAHMFSVYLPTLYGSYVLTNPTGHKNFQCSTPSDWYVEVDFATTRIYVTTSAIYGFNGSYRTPLR